MEKTENITNIAVTEYLRSFYRPLTEELGELRESAEKAGVPVILRETEAFLSMFFDLIRPRKILEIGTAIGYSSMFFAQKMTSQGVVTPSVISVEKDGDMYAAAKKNIEKLGYSKSVRLIQGDGEEAVEAIGKENNSAAFDFLFIDAAKSHYLRFLKAALPVMKKGGVVVADNTLFQAKVVSDDYDRGGRHKTNIRKLREFNEYCMNEKRFSASVAAIGDGLTIIKLL